MYSVVLTALLAGVPIATASSSRAMTTQLSSKLELHGVVPGVIATSPHDVVQVTYPSGVKVDLGNVLTPSDVRDPPQINWQADPTALYTVVMIDPDAPSRENPEFGQWRHWIKVNISGGDLTSGQSVSEYVGSGPPKGTGLHRYIFLVYKQSGQMFVDNKLKTSKNKASGREKWNATDFAADYQLGYPIAANFFLAEYDDYVPTLYKQFTEE